MLLESTISTATKSDPALDHAQLYALGLDWVRRYSGKVWTDHNTHDPGITILELLCYALTELSYRAQFPLEDILAKPTENAANMAAQFYTAAEVLPHRSLTALDYRKLLIDLPEVRNAWIAPEPLEYYADTVEKRLRRDDPGHKGIRPVAVRGLYRARIEYAEDVKTAAQREQANAQAHARLHANRNLCEDFVAVEPIETQQYILCAEIELTPDADPTEIAAQTLFQVDQYLAPPIRRYSLAEMLAKRHDDGTAYSVDEIFTGPRLEHGLFDDQELQQADLRTDVRLSDIISVVMDIPGVLAVGDIVVNELSSADNADPAAPLVSVAPANKWRVAIPAGKQPRLSLDRWRIIFYKRNLPQQAERTKVASRLTKLKDEQRQRSQSPGAEDLPIPLGRDRQIASYHSFQHHFPAVYGLSPGSLPRDASDARRDQARQLKAYLLFFDQVLANYGAQLSQAGRLFSLNASGDPQTYFAQLVGSEDEFKEIYDPSIVAASHLPPLESAEEASRRRNHFLDHLLARIGEDFQHYESIIRTRFGKLAEDAIAAKIVFLQEYRNFGGERGMAYNYSLKHPSDLWNSRNVSGLERRLAALLGIGDVSRRNLRAVPYDMYAEVDNTPDDEFRFRVKHRTSGKILLSSSTNYVTREAAQAEMEQAVTRGQHPGGYQRKVSVGGTHYFNIVDATGEIIARRIAYFATSEAMEAEISELQSYLREQYSGEGLYVIENILLRPEQADDPLLPICIDPACADCADDDPYSYRLQIVLPAYAGRFQDMDFRRFVEETIRLETPAHILPKICWTDADQMATFEQAYRDWIAIRAGVITADRQQIMNAFADALFTIKSVYPTQQLHDCSGGADEPPFVLGRTKIGP